MQFDVLGRSAYSSASGDGGDDDGDSSDSDSEASKPLDQMVLIPQWNKPRFMQADLKV